MLCIFYVFLILPFVSSQETFTVKTTKGSVSGKLITSRRGPEGYAFLGIPMTQPPVGNLRFKSAVEISSWNGTVDCFDFKSICPQPKKKARSIGVPQDEDCLYMNVMSSRNCLLKGNCSVVVYVHGGGRVYINPASTPAENIINNYANDERNVVFVSVPYRLGLLGWMHLAPGKKTSADSNLSHRDIIFGLQWVQKEINNFGGDRNKVTLFGHSSGATQVIEIILSPLSAGLFNQVLILSMLLPFPFKRYPGNNKIMAQESSIMTGCAEKGETFEDEQKVIKIENCMRNLSWKAIFDTQEILILEFGEVSGLWIDGPGGIFPEEFDILLAKPLQKMNYFLGTLTAESKEMRFALDEQKKINITKLDQICTLIGYEERYDDPEGFRTVCINHYNTLDRVTDLSDDMLYYYPTSRFADKFSQNGDVFVYSFAYPIAGERFNLNSSVPTPKHAEDLKYVTWGKYDQFIEKDFQIERVYSGMLANFVNHGNPTYNGQRWDKWTKSGREHFVIDFDENFKMPGLHKDYHKSAQIFYETVVPQSAGNSHIEYDFPYRHDFYAQFVMLETIFQVWTNASIFPQRTIESSIFDAKHWEDHLQHLKEVYKSSQHHLGWATIIFIEIVLVIVTLSGCVCAIKACDRREYHGYEYLT